MKKTKAILFSLALISAISACKKDENLDNNINKEFLLGRWEVQNPVDDFLFIEFNEQNHYVIEIEDQNSYNGISNLGGNYSVESNNSFILDNSEEVEIEKKDNNNIRVKVMLNATEFVEYNLTRKENLFDSANSKEMCRSWKIDKVNGFDAALGELDYAIIISKQGDIFIQMPVASGTLDSEIYLMKSTWSWKDSNENSLCIDDLCINDIVYAVTYTGANLKLTADMEDLELVPYNTELTQAYYSSYSKKAQSFFKK